MAKKLCSRISRPFFRECRWSKNSCLIFLKETA